MTEQQLKNKKDEIKNMNMDELRRLVHQLSNTDLEREKINQLHDAIAERKKYIESYGGAMAVGTDLSDFQGGM